MTGNYDIFVMDADGGNVRNLTRSYYDHIVPTWR
jgi:Tol biopolymer transport system component